VDVAGPWRSPIRAIGRKVVVATQELSESELTTKGDRFTTSGSPRARAERPARMRSRRCESERKIRVCG